MIDTRDKHDFMRLREPTLEDWAFPPAFLRGSRRHGPFEPIGRGPARLEPEPWRVSLAELVGLFVMGTTLGFVLGLYFGFTPR